MKTKEEIRGYKRKLLVDMYKDRVSGLYTRAVGAAFTAQLADGGVEEFNPRSEAPFPDDGNIVGLAYGLKEVDGKVTKEEALKIYVKEKRPDRWLEDSEKIPPKVGSLATDVVVTGEIKADPAVLSGPMVTAGAINPRTRMRPTKCGVSVGHYLITAGTLGCRVAVLDGGTGKVFILSNNHVLANSNSARLGDLILQPGPADGGKVAQPLDWLAKLSDFEVITMGGPANHVDAAIAQVLNAGDVDPEILTIGKVTNPPIAAAAGMKVHKYGRTTLYTQGKVIDTSADIWVSYGSHSAWFEDQISIRSDEGDFSLGGDSGSLILKAEKNEPVALLFAGGGGVTFANPIDLVLRRFNIRIE